MSPGAPPPSVGKSSSLCMLGACFLCLSLEFVGVDPIPLPPPPPAAAAALAAGGTYFFTGLGSTSSGSTLK